MSVVDDRLLGGLAGQHHYRRGTAQIEHESFLGWAEEVRIEKHYLWS